MTLLLQADENGTLTIPAELLAGAGPNAQYQVEQRADNLILRPAPLEAETKQAASDAWWQNWLALTEAMGKDSTTDRSALDILSEMRR